MNVLLIACVVLGALASVIAGALAFDLHRSDPAGNGLTQAYLAIVLCLTWVVVTVVVIATAARAPHANVAAELPWTAVSWASVALLALAISAQFPAFAFLSDATNRGTLFRALQWCVPLVPLAFLLHAAWRLGLPLPWHVGLWVPGAVVILGSLLSFAPWAVKGGPGAGAPRQPEIVLPALLVQEGELVRVLRDRDDLRSMPRDLLPRLREPFVVDANRYRFALQGLHQVPGEAADGAVPVAFEAARDPEPMPFEAVRDLVLRIAPLHADAAEDARIRKLVGMQKDVTALSFVLPR